MTLNEAKAFARWCGGWCGGWLLVGVGCTMLIGVLPIGRDDTDPGAWGGRSGMMPATDAKTGCQYLLAPGGSPPSWGVDWGARWRQGLRVDHEDAAQRQHRDRRHRVRATGLAAAEDRLIFSGIFFFLASQQFVAQSGRLLTADRINYATQESP